MSEKPAVSQTPEPEEASQGPNLILVYSLLGAALVIAMLIAALIVLPFYRHH